MISNFQIDYLPNGSKSGRPILPKIEKCIYSISSCRNYLFLLFYQFLKPITHDPISNTIKSTKHFFSDQSIYMLNIIKNMNELSVSELKLLILIKSNTL